MSTTTALWPGVGAGVSAVFAWVRPTESGVPRSVVQGGEKWPWKSARNAAPGSIWICGAMVIGATVHWGTVGKKMAPRWSRPSIGVTAATMASSAVCHFGSGAPASGAPASASVNFWFMLSDWSKTTTMLPGVIMPWSATLPHASPSGWRTTLLKPESMRRPPSPLPVEVTPPMPVPCVVVAELPPDPVVPPLDPHAEIAAPVQHASESPTRYAVFLMVNLLVPQAIPVRVRGEPPRRLPAAPRRP